MKKLLFLINPTSGKRALEDSLMHVVRIFSDAGFDVNIHLSKDQDDLYHCAYNGGTYDLIVCCGGDGTLNIVVNAVYQSGNNTLIGYIPGGTTNDFANSRHIDSIATGAAKQIAEGIVRDVDLGILEEKPFVYVAAFGMFADVSYLTSRENKQNFGHAAYVFSGIKSFAKAKTYSLRIEHDGEVLEGDFIFGMVSNSKRIGGFELPIIKNVLYDDGEMEVTLVRKPKNTMDTTHLLNCLLTQSSDEANIHTFKTASLRFSCDEEIPWSLDGEFGGAFKSGEIQVKGGAVRMIF
ncbi:MAG: diacylglycerol kinase family lipid kinase [Clostridiales bacterium]|jgi:diacylglycerol kinase (ATP)|nr:diacylglycerol kinase family lipid kinase [Clostridiales bacterium]